MGIQGLLPFLHDISKKCYINEFRGYTVAIDSYCLLHKGVFACADKLVRGEDSNIYVQYCFKYLDLLLSCNVKPIMVFDGQHLPAKRATELKRREARQAARNRGNELLRLGKSKEALVYFRQCVDITHKMALKLIKECRARNIDCIVAPYEADAQLAYLNLHRIADVIITEDSDLVMFGCEKVLFKFNLDGSGMLVERDKLCAAMKMGAVDYSFDKFRNMCILSGCDYLESLPGIGIKRAHKAIKMTSDPDVYKLIKRLPSYLNLRNLTVDEDYLENFRLAEATIKHQVVYDPVKRSLVRLTDPGIGMNKKYLKNAGQMYDENLAFQMALGNVDPFSKEVLDDWLPGVAPSNTNFSRSIWSSNFKNKGAKLVFGFETPIVKGGKSKCMSPEEEAAAIEQRNIDFDNQLAEELKVYSLPLVPKKCKNKEEEIHRSEINVNKSEIQLTVAAKNPFLITNQMKRLSKFNLTNTGGSEYVRSKFFSSKWEDIKSEQTTKELGDSKSNVEIEKEISLVTETTSTKSDPLSYFDSFSVNKSSKKVMKASKGEALEEGGSEHCCNESFSLKEYDEPLNVKSSPVLSYSQAYAKQSNSSNKRKKSNLESFKYDKIRKRLIRDETPKQDADVTDRKSALLTETAITDIHISSEASICENYDAQTIERESDVENLTPEEVSDCDDVLNKPEQFIDLSIDCDLINTKVKNKDNNSAMKEDDNIPVLKSRAFSQEVTNTSGRNEKCKKFNSCRTLGLSRIKNRPTPQNQPTLLAMFKKMSSKD